MRHIPAMVDMARTAEEKEEDAERLSTLPSLMSGPDYPYGLCISLTEAEMEKLDLDDDVQVGDMLHMFVMAKVTSVSARESEGEKCCRVELQITHIAAESEDEENEEEDAEEDDRGTLKRLYR